MPKNNKVAAATSLLKILARIDRLEKEVRTRKVPSQKNCVTFNDVKKIQKIILRGIETIQTQYERMGETFEDLQEFAKYLEQFVECEDEEMLPLQLLKFERIFDCEGEE